MPKEVIRCDRDAATVQAIVTWSRESSNVQVATTNWSMRTSGHPLDPKPGWYVTLDRASINKMIRALRKARDQAFGSDA